MDKALGMVIIDYIFQIVVISPFARLMFVPVEIASQKVLWNLWNQMIERLKSNKLQLLITITKQTEIWNV